MGAPKGNRYAEGNEGGRPPIYDRNKPEDVSRLNELSIKYFEELMALVVSKPPTVTGLSLYLGFDSKSTLYDYAKKKEFSHSIKTALTKIEQYHEEKVADGDKCTGNIFVLKNFDWKDKSETENKTDINITGINIKDIISFDSTE